MEIDAGDAAGLAEGSMHGVERDGVKVLLARSDGRCHVVGATCLHAAGGPLSEGVLHDGAVVCPWHDLPRFDLRVDAGRLLLGPATPPTPVQEDADPRTMVIMGSGASRPSTSKTGAYWRSRAGEETRRWRGRSG